MISSWWSCAIWKRHIFTGSWVRFFSSSSLTPPTDSLCILAESSCVQKQGMVLAAADGNTSSVLTPERVVGCGSQGNRFSFPLSSGLSFVFAVAAEGFPLPEKYTLLTKVFFLFVLPEQMDWFACSLGSKNSILLQRIEPQHTTRAHWWPFLPASPFLPTHPDQWLVAQQYTDYS